MKSSTKRRIAEWLRAVADGIYPYTYADAVNTARREMERENCEHGRDPVYCVQCWGAASLKVNGRHIPPRPLPPRFRGKL